MMSSRCGVCPLFDLAPVRSWVFGGEQFGYERIVHSQTLRVLERELTFAKQIGDRKRQSDLEARIRQLAQEQSVFELAPSEPANGDSLVDAEESRCSSFPSEDQRSRRYRCIFASSVRKRCSRLELIRSRLFFWIQPTSPINLETFEAHRNYSLLI